MTYALSTVDRGEDLLTLFREASLARTSLAPEKEKGLQDPDLGYGGRWRELSEKYDLSTSSWKTARSLFPVDLDWFSVTLPRWGIMLDGECWALTTQALPTLENASGSWPTPTVHGNYNRKGSSKKSGDGLATVVWNTPTTMDSLPIRSEEALQRNYEKNRPGRTKHSTLREQVAYPSPEKMWPTPTKRDYKGPYRKEYLIAKGGFNRMTLLPDAVYHGGTKTLQNKPKQLNPAWVGWLMGWPIGWTELKPLAMGKYQLWLDLHGKH